MDTNPYTAPRISNDEPETLPSVSRGATTGMAVAGILGAVYLIVVIASGYECVRAPPGWSIAGYVREGILSTVFLVICAVTVRKFKARSHYAGVWMMFCPVLLVIFIYPGTGAVQTFLLRLFGR